MAPARARARAPLCPIRAPPRWRVSGVPRPALIIPRAPARLSPHLPNSGWGSGTKPPGWEKGLPHVSPPWIKRCGALPQLV